MITFTHLLLALAALASNASALYFYIDGPREKCFYEDLPKDTMVVGHFKALLFNDASNSYIESQEMGISITVDEAFDSHHRVVSQKSGSAGKFTFSAADSGEHKICYTPTGIHGSSGFFGSSHERGNVKLEVDIAIGESSKIESNDKEKIGDIVSKIRDLNARLQDIRREQIFQREREAEFRDQSEAVNARVLSHLRSFFIKQKLT